MQQKVDTTPHPSPHKKRGALAVFVKTLGQTPLKTRLAQGIGRGHADDFYRLSVNAVGEVVENYCNSSIANLTPYWAISESHCIAPPTGDPAISKTVRGDKQTSNSNNLWKAPAGFFTRGFRGIWQGTGGLGDRLHRVYQSLLEDYDYVIIIGSDCPQISHTSIHKAANTYEDSSDFVVGEAADGGFWLFSGATPISKDVWTSTEYSAETTSQQLCAAIMSPQGSFNHAFDAQNNLAGAKPHRSIKRIDTFRDVDEVTDLPELKRELARLEFIEPAQQEILEWLSSKNLLEMESLS